MKNTSQNILFILNDQQMASALGCYGDRICKTPNIDSLAFEGLRFDNAYTVCPVCTPARASIQTGLYPFKHGMQTNIYTRGCMVHELPDNPELLPRRLQKLGYQTGYTGKWHLGFGPEPEKNGEYRTHVHHAPYLGKVKFTGTLPSTFGYQGDDFPGHGGIGLDTPQFKDYLAHKGINFQKRMANNSYPETFEVLSGTESTPSHFLAESAISTIDDFITDGKPFYYMLNFWGPHSHYHASTEFLDMYRNVEIPEWPSFREEQSSKPSIHNAHRTETTAGWDWSRYQDLIRYYYANITEIDSKIGMLVDFLKRKEVYDNTVIIFSADHGESIGIHDGLTDKSFFMYEETMRIPLVVKPAKNGKKASGALQQTRDELVHTCDLYSTILELAGAERRSVELDGRSLLPIIKGEAVKWRESLVAESSGLDFLLFTQRMLRTGQMKYIFNCSEPDELYDLSADPFEMVNLVAAPGYSVDLMSMRRELEKWMLENGDGLLERYRRLRHLF